MRTLLAVLALSQSLVLSLPATAGETDQAAAVEALRQPNAILIDVRTPEEVAEDGTLPGALNIGYEDIGQHIAEVAPDKDAPIVLYCRSGRRAGIAQDSLQELGYSRVINGGGYQDLKTAVHKD
ncbi:rhodanese-like domain-containing protein [Pseudomonas resinovorans]|uniref:rhodanese-like domain-containing protein n=1 Tax=Metapseudomonas resinovorans TaxID=53412 RepID=UPI00237FC40B|nr:rhodanese-like domain-containing protein [Pseudomonas resinovorans]MDE3736551.1 rhodanese-like domain-containing protein [Pseudomonas resinovorans]